MSLAFFHKIGAAESGVSKTLADALRFVPRLCQMFVMRHQKDPFIISLVSTIVREKTSHMWPRELANVYMCAQSATKIPGDFAEVGVYKGGSAKLIAHAKGDRTLHLFDTFTGLPTRTSEDPAHMKPGMYATTREAVETYLSSYQDVYLHPGLFPHTRPPETTYAFAHIDVDLYTSTLEALQYFYPRLNKGGIILSHDYSTVAGVRNAFVEFFADKPEPIIECSTSQCLVVKM